MKINDLFESIKDFRDPDHDAGAFKREGDARAALSIRQKDAVDNLNLLIKKYKLGAPLKVGTFTGVAGEYIMNSNYSDKGDFKFDDGTKAKAYIMTDTHQEMRLVMSNVEADDKKLKEFAKTIYSILDEMPLMCGAINEPQHKYVTFKLGNITHYNDKQKVKKLKQVIDQIKTKPF